MSVVAETGASGELGDGSQDVHLELKETVQLCLELAIQINTYCKQTGVRFDRMISVPRGGLFVTMALSQMLHWQAPELLSASLTSYDQDARRSDGTFREGQMPMAEEIRGLSILMPDDVIDSGNTENRLKTRFLKQGAARVMTASLYDKPGNHEVDIVPDFCVRTVSGLTWVHFPWEPLGNLIEDPCVFSGLGYTATTNALEVLDVKGSPL